MAAESDYNALKLENQLCFPLYACSRSIVNLYTPFLKPLGLTYTQYIVFLVLWEQDGITVADDGLAVIFVQSFQLALCLQNQAGGDFPAANGRHELFQLGDLADIGALVDQAAHVHR